MIRFGSLGFYGVNKRVFDSHKISPWPIGLVICSLFFLARFLCCLVSAEYIAMLRRRGSCSWLRSTSRPKMEGSGLNHFQFASPELVLRSSSEHAVFLFSSRFNGWYCHLEMALLPNLKTLESWVKHAGSFRGQWIIHPFTSLALQYTKFPCLSIYILIN